MRFRKFVSAIAPFEEGDLLGVPPSGASIPSPAQSNPSDHPKSGSEDEPHGHSAATSRSPHQLQRAVTLATELQKLLSSLPHPLSKQFHAFVEPLEALLARLQELG